MKTILMGRRHSKTNWELIAGPNVPVSEQIAKRAEFAGPTTNVTWAEVQIWREEHHKHALDFLTPDEAKAQSEQAAKADAEFKKQREANEKRIADKLATDAKVAQEAHQKKVAELSKQHDEFRKAFKPK